MKPGHVVLLCIALGLAGCLPTVRAAQPRYFTPLAMPVDDPVDPRADARARVDQGARAGSALRLGRVSAAAHLKERMVWRRSDVEFGFRELRRWTQPPARFVEQAIAAELFERRRFRRADTGAVANLEVELRSFDEILGDERSALVELAVLLTDRKRVSLLERTIAVREPVAGSDPVEVARALGAALRRAVRELGEGLEAALAQAP